MQKSDHYTSGFGDEKEDSDISHRLPRDPDISQASSYGSARSISLTHSLSQTTLRSSNSFRVKAQEFAAGFVTCFIPHRHATCEGAEHEDGSRDVSDFSTTSSSKMSTISSGSNYRFRTHGSYSKKETQQETIRFSIEEINKATSNFASENRIGQGGFGAIYKGKLKDGTLIAVKRARKNMYDVHLSVEFKSEIETLSKVEHLNLVRFLGCLETDNERLILVEYVSNGNLREHLDGTRGNGLEIGQRLNIAIDVAHAVAYLHTYADHPIIHRDIKASNILLTDKLRAKVADFGFARLAAEDPEATHVSTQIKGTAGYLDPEYLRTYQLTEKSDVYSFGVLLVEIVTGRRPIERNRDNRERVTTRWAIRRFKEGDAVMAMDPRLRRSPAAVGATQRVLGLAERCMEKDRRSRPSMRECAEVLWGIRRDSQSMLQSSSTTR
ncbi:calmodulin-binding receptor-like cytoplasmic kinase 1 [Musa acuminata AAA Group]|uniref:calmodulin-binding receptor-like cytoplasmic kinase 1 n=1 Tax=Musa acuminata AAA Group TaxID=214697 RepID=UPI0031DD32DD